MSSESHSTFHFKPSSQLKHFLLDSKRPFIHRELSWLQFNSRVLAEAKDPTNPLLERLKFLAISSSNLDEFFMVRMASLGQQIAHELKAKNNLQVDRLRRIRLKLLKNIKSFNADQTKVFSTLCEELRPLGIDVVLDMKVRENLREPLRKLFIQKILPELNLLESLASTSLSRVDNLQLIVYFNKDRIIRIPKSLAPMWTLETEKEGKKIYQFFFLDRLLEMFLPEIMGTVETAYVLRLTRDADLSVNLDVSDPESIPDVLLTNLIKRERGHAIRLQLLRKLPKDILTVIQKAYKLTLPQTFVHMDTLVMQGLWHIVKSIPHTIPEAESLFYPFFKPLMPRAFEDRTKLFDYLKSRDFLLHHPYDSFDAYVTWIRAACEDPKTTMIQQTIYRMDALSPILGALKKAAKSKTIRIFIELRARFDEFNNLKLAEELKQAGVQVVYGISKLKLHAKVALITRHEDGKAVHYTHLSTGNYNSMTARLYTDLAIMTADPQIGQDADLFFNSVLQGQVPGHFKKLLSAPTQMHRKIIDLIEHEMKAAHEGKPARIVAKVNSLVDEAVIQKLYQASQAGVTCDLIVRGACSLIPGAKGLSENIRVISIVDRFLEHSRIYYFQNAEALFFSSADWMQRNFFKRLELAFPVSDPALFSYVRDVIIQAYLNDTVKAQTLGSDGLWTKRTTSDPRMEPVRSQFFFEALAQNTYQGTTLEALK